MNKIIDLRMEQARSTMREYEAAASALAQAVSDQIKEETGWGCKWHLGDYEAGIDTITIEVDSCCFDDAIAYEIKLMGAFAPTLRGPHFNIRTTSHKYNCPIHSKKTEVIP